jgi:hypothetical protein
MRDLVSKAVELAVGQGLWAVLYLYLFFRMLKENKEREDRYLQMAAFSGQQGRNTRPVRAIIGGQQAA